MARFTRNLMNALRPFKRIRNEIGKVQSEIAKTREEIISNIGLDIRNALAYNILRDSNLAYKDELLMALYPKNGGKVGVTSDFSTMKRYLNAVRPVRVKNLVRVGGENDGGYVMINPKIDLLNKFGNSFSGSHSADLSQDYGANPIVSMNFTRNFTQESRDSGAIPPPPSIKLLHIC